MGPITKWFAGSLALGLLASGTGCTTVASTLGFTPPVHKLIKPAQEFRDQAVHPVDSPKELNKVPLGAYIVEPGDTLAVEATDLDSPIRLPGSQPVMQDGTIDLGKFGRPVVGYKTLAQIELDIRKLIDAQVKEKTPITVRLIGRESKVYYVLGEANAPRAYPLSGRETVLDGILTAGGLTRQADSKQIILSRPTPADGCRVVLPVCYNQIVQLGDTSTNYQLQPGDRIYIPSQSPFGDFWKKQTKPRDVPTMPGTTSRMYHRCLCWCPCPAGAYRQMMNRNSSSDPIRRL